MSETPCLSLSLPCCGFYKDLKMFWLRLVLILLVASLVYAKEQDEESDRREQRKRFAICKLRSAYGNCKGRRLQWTYNIYRKECERFRYSNCGGNPNRFHTSEQCMSYCNPQGNV